MRLAAVMALTLGGCAAMHGPLDVITPDELTLGQGSASASMDGKLDTHWGYDSWDSTYEGESESTYAALTWDIPTWEGRDEGMDRQTQRNLSLLIDQMVADEVEEEGGTFTMADGSKAPPVWVILAIGGVLLAAVTVLALRSGREDEW